MFNEYLQLRKMGHGRIESFKRGSGYFIGEFVGRFLSLDHERALFSEDQIRRYENLLQKTHRKYHELLVALERNDLEGYFRKKDEGHKRD